MVLLHWWILPSINGLVPQSIGGALVEATGPGFESRLDLGLSAAALVVGVGVGQRERS
jgi:hypothetical protein